MKSLLTLAFLLCSSAMVASAQTSAQGLVAVPGTCERQFSGDYCNCTITSPIQNGSTFTGSVQCSTLSCYHFKNFEIDESCVYPPLVATCTLVNPSYSGQCTATEERKTGQTAQQACEEVLACLSNTGCLKTYCNATQIRTGWELVGVGSNNN